MLACLLLVPVVVPAVVPGTQDEEVQAVQQCGSAASDATICAGRGLEAAGQAEASERWGWVASGAVVAVAGAAVVAALLMMRFLVACKTRGADATDEETGRGEYRAPRQHANMRGVVRACRDRSRVLGLMSLHVVVLVGD